MNNEQDTSRISVYGVGYLKIKPNMILIKLYISNISKTLNEAQAEVNKNASTLLKITEELKIENVTTNIMNFSPAYEWDNHKKIFVGQEVRQGFVITINDININLQKAKDLLDRVTADIKSLDCNVTLCIDNFEEKITEARNTAYNNALEKAKQYAKLANLEIIKTIKVSEFEPRDADCYPERYNNMICGSDADPTEIPVGDINIEAKLYCDFLAKEIK